MGGPADEGVAAFVRLGRPAGQWTMLSGVAKTGLQSQIIPESQAGTGSGIVE
jgi:hypothetical protein